MHYKISQLVLTPRRKTDSVSYIFVAQPNAHKEALAGKLFLLIEINDKKNDGQKIINFLVDNLNNNYYQNEKIILRERISTLKIEHIFESTLAKTNKNLVEFLKNEKIKIDINSLNIIVGVVYENNLYFTSVGRNKALLIYKLKQDEENQITNAAKQSTQASKNQYKIVDITSQAKIDMGSKRSSLAKLFTNVISGIVPKKGYFVFTNENLPEYISNKQLIDIITSLPPASASEQIKNILKKVNAYVPFLCIIIKNTTGIKIAEPIKELSISSSKDSIDTLNITEDKTEKLLTPSGAVQTKKWTRLPTRLISLASKALNRIISKQTEHSGLKDKILFKKHTSRFSLSRIFSYIRNIFKYTISFIAHLFKNKDKKKFDQEIPASPQAPKVYARGNIIKKVFIWFKRLNTKNKFLIIIAIVSIALLAQNLFILNIKNKQIIKEQGYLELVNSIKQKDNQAEASLLYNNETDAKKYLDEMKELIEKLPRDSEEQQRKFDQFNSKYQEKLERILHVIKTDSANMLTDFTNLNSNARPINIILVNEKNKLYLADHEQKTIYSFDLNNQLPTAIADLEIDIKQFNYPALDNENNIYYYNQDNIIELSAETEEINQYNINLEKSAEIAAMASFNNRLYLLDKNSNQIFKYNKADAAFVSPAQWLKEKVNLANAVDVSIDGYIYILDSSGQLAKYFKGQKQAFELESNMVEPAIEKPTKVTVSIIKKYIYIFEPSKQRLVIFDKKGQFLNQYVYQQFNALIDYAVDEVNQKIYILNNTSLYQFEAKHLE